MSIGTIIYRRVTSRFSTIFLAASVGAFVLNYVINEATDAYWDRLNAGKQWKDIKAKLS